MAEQPRVRLDPNKGGYRKAFECAGEDLRNPADIPFIPTDEWQEIIPGQLTPPGLKVRMDIESGKTFGRLLPKAPPVEDLAYLLLQKKELLLTVDETDNNGSTLMHRMCEKGALDCVQFLIKEKASIALYNDKGVTPFHIAIAKGFDDVATFLFNLDKKQLTQITKQKDAKGPLHLAAYAGCLPLVKLFIGAGAKVNAKTPRGEGCLHLAGQRGSVDVLEYLVNTCKADLAITNADGQTAAEVCTDFEKASAAAWLEQVRSDRVLDALMGDLGVAPDKGKKAKKPKFVKPAEDKAAAGKAKKGKGKYKGKPKTAAPVEEEDSAPSSGGGGSGLVISETQNSQLVFPKAEPVRPPPRKKAPVVESSDDEDSDSDKEFSGGSDLD